MKQLHTATFALLLIGYVVSGIFPTKAQDQNPYSIWCDYHGAYLFKSGTEYPSGVCYDVYKHTYYKDGRTYEHKATMKCKR